MSNIFHNPDQKKQNKISALRSKIEEFFERSTHLIYQNPLKSLFLVFAFIGALSSQIPKLTIETTSESLLHENDQSRVEYDAFKEEFGKYGLVIVAIQTPDVFDPRFLQKLKSLHQELENEVPYVQTVSSLFSVKQMGVDGLKLISQGLLDGWPEKEADLDSVRQMVINSPIYRNHIISEDGRVTAILIETKDSIIGSGETGELDAYFHGDKDSGRQRHLNMEETSQIVQAVHRIVNPYRSKDFIVALSGGVVISDVYNKFAMKDMKMCLSLGLIVIAFFLMLLFRRFSGIVLPMIVINATMLSTLGLMAIFHVTIKIPTTVLPAFLLTVCVCDSVHIMSVFYKGLNHGKSKEDAIIYALGHSGISVAMTSLTTFAGSISFSFSELSAISEIGIFGATGVMLAFLFTIIMLPAIISIIPLKQKSIGRVRISGMDNVLLFFANYSSSNPRKIIIVSIIVFCIFTLFCFRLRFSHNQIDWFPDKMAVKKDIQFIDRELKGSITLDVIVDAKKKNGILNTDILNGIEQFSRKISNYKNEKIFVGKVVSINDFIKDLNQAFHGDDPAYYAIPQNIEEIPLDLFLSVNEVPEFLKKLIDSQFSKAHIMIKAPWVDAIAFEDLIGDIKKELGDIFQGKAEVTVTGPMALVARAIPASLHSMVVSYISSDIAITSLMILLVADIKVGFYMMFPNILPIVIIMGIMGIMGIPLDMVTIMIGSISIGLVVDDTIHLVYNFQKNYNSMGDLQKAMKETMLYTGRAMLTTSLVLSSGFFILMFASLNNMIRFGFFTGLAIVIAMLAEFLLSPALMAFITKSRRKDRVC